MKCLPLLAVLCAVSTLSVQAQPPAWNGRYMADTITHADNLFFPFARHEPAENCSSISLQHAEGDWGRWAMDVTAFETGTRIQANVVKTGIYRVRGDSVQFNGFGWSGSGHNYFEVSVRGDTLELARANGAGGVSVFSRWLRRGSPEHEDFENGMRYGMLIFKFGCSR